jgi:hypothetical protein
MKRREMFFVCLVLSSVPACGGHSVDLDQTASDGTPTTFTSTPSGDEVISLPEAISTLWVDQSRFYWLTSSSSASKLQGCLKADCDHTIVTYASPGEIGGIVGIGGGHVYWLSHFTIKSCPGAGCDGAPTQVVEDPAAFDSALSVDGDYVYWSSSLDIYRCRYSGCDSTPELVAAQELASSKLSFQGSTAYWADDYAAPGDPGLILSSPSDGSAPASTVLQANANDLATDASNIYWAESTDLGVAGQYSPVFTVSSCPLVGCDSAAPTKLATIENSMSNFQVEGTSMYWLETQAGVPNTSSVHSCPLTGCGSSSKVFASGAELTFAVDDDFVYWVTPDNGQKAYVGSKHIHRTPK